MSIVLLSASEDKVEREIIQDIYVCSPKNAMALRDGIKHKKSKVWRKKDT